MRRATSNYRGFALEFQRYSIQVWIVPLLKFQQELHVYCGGLAASADLLRVISFDYAEVATSLQRAQEQVAKNVMSSSSQGVCGVLI